MKSLLVKTVFYDLFLYQAFIKSIFQSLNMCSNLKIDRLLTDINIKYHTEYILYTI